MTDEFSIRVYRPALHGIAFAFMAAVSTSVAGPVASTLDKGIIYEEPGKAIVYAVSRPKWSFSAGATVRSIDAGFRFDGGKLGPLDWRRHVHPRSGLGNQGLFLRGDGTVFYDDGFVGPDVRDPFYFYAAELGVESASQVRDIPFTAPFTRTGKKTQAVFDFHTSQFGYSSSLTSVANTVGDSDTGAGPQFQLGYNLIDSQNCLLNVVTGWSYLSTDHGSGNQSVATQTITETARNYTYTYASGYGNFGGGAFSAASVFISDTERNHGGFPFQSEFGFPFTIIRPSIEPGANIPRPSQSAETSRSTFAQFYAMSRSDLDVDLNEIPIGLEIGRQVGPVELFLTAGATLNIINYELTNDIAWYQMGRSRALESHRYRDSGTPLKVGLYAGLSARCPITDDGRIYLEAHGSYRWVDPVHASAGIADVEIDASSWEGGVGVGILFDGLFGSAGTPRGNR